MSIYCEASPIDFLNLTMLLQPNKRYANILKCAFTFTCQMTLTQGCISTATYDKQYDKQYDHQNDQFQFWTFSVATFFLSIHQWKWQKMSQMKSGYCLWMDEVSRKFPHSMCSPAVGHPYHVPYNLYAANGTWRKVYACNFQYYIMYGLYLIIFHLRCNDPYRVICIVFQSIDNGCLR